MNKLMIRLHYYLLKFQIRCTKARLLKNLNH